MEEITSANLNIDGIKNLGAAMLLNATKDYCRANEGNQKKIIKELRSGWCDLLTDGRSLIIAEKLLTHSEEIKERLEANRDDIPQRKLGEELKCS